MSRENVELVRRGHEAFRREGEEALFAFFDPDVDLTPIEELPGLESYHGHDGVRRYFEATREVFGAFGWEPLELVDFGDDVLAVTRFHARGRDSGVPIDVVIYNVFTVRNGRVVRVRGSLDRSSALQAAGLAE